MTQLNVECPCLYHLWVPETVVDQWHYLVALRLWLRGERKAFHWLWLFGSVLIKKTVTILEFFLGFLVYAAFAVEYCGQLYQKPLKSPNILHLHYDHPLVGWECYHNVQEAEWGKIFLSWIHVGSGWDDVIAVEVEFVKRWESGEIVMLLLFFLRFVFCVNCNNQMMRQA